jgi:hypothetical protein
VPGNWCSECNWLLQNEADTEIKAFLNDDDDDDDDEIFEDGLFEDGLFDDGDGLFDNEVDDEVAPLKNIPKCHFGKKCRHGIQCRYSHTEEEIISFSKQTTSVSNTQSDDDEDDDDDDEDEAKLRELKAELEDELEREEMRALEAQIKDLNAKLASCST